MCTRGFGLGLSTDTQEEESGGTGLFCRHNLEPGDTVPVAQAPRGKCVEEIRNFQGNLATRSLSGWHHGLALTHSHVFDHRYHEGQQESVSPLDRCSAY